MAQLRFRKRARVFRSFSAASARRCFAGDVRPTRVGRGGSKEFASYMLANF
jgi:hypothetical protein